MFVIQALTSLLAFLAITVQASPLSRRDVVVPRITNPTAGSVWPIGSVQTVTWDTSNFPPDSQITNPIGRVILGIDANNSLNLDLQHPLASGFKLTDGSVQVTVPDVTPRDDYLIVLMGDSGNASPTFAITRISAPGSNTTTTSSAATLISTPIPISGTAITGGSTDSPGSATINSDTVNLPLPTSISPTTSIVGATTTATAPGPNSTAVSATNAGRSIHTSSGLRLVTVSLGTVLLAMLLMM